MGLLIIVFGARKIGLMGGVITSQSNMRDSAA
jgi:hypothetical protein